MSHKRYTLNKVLSFKKYEQLSEGEALRTVWITKDFQFVLITNLRDDHLTNIIDRFKDMPHWRLEQQPYIYGEVKRRKQLELAKNSKAGAVLYGRKTV